MKKFLSLITAVLTFLSNINVQAQENNMTDKKILVTYFSATGTTAKVAERLSQAINADLFEIKPVHPYSNADLDWTDKKSRSSVEMADKSSRPAIADQVADMSQYNVVFVGFPIWWYREPSIIDTFMESYNFAGKTVIPFATSGMSSIGDSGKNMQALAPSANVLEGKRFSAGVSAEELKSWAEGLF